MAGKTIANAEPVGWTSGGGSSKLWSNSANWSSASVPSATSAVTIDTGTAKNQTVRTTVDSAAVAATLDIGHSGAVAKATLVQTQGSGTLAVGALHLLSGGWLQVLNTTLPAGTPAITAATMQIDDKAIVDITAGNTVSVTSELSLAGTIQGDGKIIAGSIVQTDGRMGAGRVETDSYDMSGGKTATTTIAFSTSFVLSGTGAVSDVGATLIGGAGSTMTQSGGIMGGTVSGIDSYTQSGGAMGVFLDGFINGTVTTATYSISGGSITGAVNFSTLFALSGTGNVDASAALTGSSGSTMTQSGGAMDGMVTGVDSYTQSGGAMTGDVTTETYALTGADATSAGGVITASKNFDLAIEDGTAIVEAKLSGEAGLTKSGAGTVVLANGDNDFSGAVAVTAGTLEAIDGALPDTAAVTVADGATLAFKTVSDTVFMGTIDGSGGELVKTGSASLTLGGDVTMGGLNVNEGLLQVGTGVSDNIVSFDYAVVDEGATLYVATGATLTIRIPNNLTNNGTFINDGTVNDDLDNTGPFINNSVYNADVLSNTDTIDNTAPGIWTGDIVSNVGTIRNNSGAEWGGNVQANGKIIKNSGVWTGDIESNEGQISNEGVGSWTGDVLSNNNTILNLAGGTWTGDVVGNGGGTNEDAEIINRGAWTGAVKNNSDIVYNDGGVWIGDVEANDDLIANLVGGTWTGEVLSNYGHLGNDGVWTGDIVNNDGDIRNNTGAAWVGNIDANWTAIESSGIWTGDVGANYGTVDNLEQGNWDGDVQSNDGMITNGLGAIWTGDVVTNGGTLTSLGVWNGDILANGGRISNGDVWNGDILGNQREIANENGATWNGDVIANRYIIYNRSGGTWNGDILGNGGDGDFNPIFNSGTWTGDVKANSSAVYNEVGGIWMDNVESNDLAVNNLGGVWTGDIWTNDGQVINEDGGIWNGDILANDNAIFNIAGGTWNGDVIANGGSNDSTWVINRGEWNGDVESNAGGVTNEGGTWNGDILGNDGSIYNETNGTWIGDVAANGVGGNVGTEVINRGAWTGDVLTNDATIYNDVAATWTGDVLSNAGRIVTTNVWNGDIVSAGRVSARGAINGTFANSGELRVTGALTGITTLTNTATLSMVGNGTTQVLTVGAVDFGDGSYFDIDVDAAGGNDRLFADTATLDGTVRVTAASTGGAYDPSRVYTILSADVITGTFDGVTTDLAFLDPRLAHGDTSVELTLKRNDVGFAEAGTTFNQQAAAGGAESLGTGNAIYDAVLWLGQDEVAGAFDSLSGEAYASFETVSIQSASLLADVIMARIDSAFAVPRDASLPVHSYASGASFASDAIKDTGAWATLYGASARLAGDGNTADVDSSTGGVAGGIDGLLGDWRLGAVMHAGLASATIDDRATSGDSTDYGVGLYGGRAWGATQLALGATYTRHDWDVSRGVGFAGFSDSLSARYSSGTAQAFAKLSHKFELGAVSLIPYASLAYIHQSADGFGETGGAAALAIQSASGNAAFATIGLGGAQSFVMGDMLLNAKAGLGWRHAYADAPGATRSFSGGDGFYVVGASVARDTAVFNAGLELAISPVNTLAVTYDGQAGTGGTQSHAVKGSWAVRF